MSPSAWFVIIAVAAYVLGAFPLAYLVARKRGIDLTHRGTGQAGAGNLLRTSGSFGLGLGVGAFDLAKGILMMWLGKLAGLDAASQIYIGLAVVAGHNWSVFLRFNGGRGVATVLGILAILPLINDITPWIALTFVAVAALGLLILRSTPLPVLAGLAAAPIASHLLGNPLSVTLAFAAVLIVVVVKRLTAPRSEFTVGAGELIMNRLLFDRDIRDRRRWMYRKINEKASR